jgi:6-phosphogluconolactonase
MIEWRTHNTALQAAQAIAGHVAQELERAIALRGIAVLAVSGGKSPIPFFHALRQVSLDWRRVIITLADDRQVEEASPLSNAALVRRELLAQSAAAATFVPLHFGRASLPLPFDMLVLGMGLDAHTASLFPGQPMRGERPLIAVTPDPLPPEAPVARWSWSLDTLRAARQTALLISGAQKRDVLEAALAQPENANAPIAAVLQNAHEPAKIFWSE